MMDKKLDDGVGNTDNASKNLSKYILDNNIDIKQICRETGLNYNEVKMSINGNKKSLDVGNTTTQLGIFKNDKLIHEFRYITKQDRTSDEIGTLIITFFSHFGINIKDFQGATITTTSSKSAKFSKIFCKSSICFCNFLDTLAVKKKGFLTTINFCSLNKLDSVKLAINSSKPSLSQSTVTCSKSLKRSSLAYDLTK